MSQEHQQADDFIRENKLDIAIPYIWNDISTWSTWFGNQAVSQPIALSNVTDETVNEEGKEIIRKSFAYNGSHFSFEMTERPQSEDEKKRGELLIKANYLEVIRLELEYAMGDVERIWQYRKLLSLIDGQWVRDIAEIYKALKADNDRIVSSTIAPP